MFLSPELIHAIEAVLKNLQPDVAQFISVKPVHGGSINRSYQIKTNSKTYFLKTNPKDSLPDMFLVEAEGLKRIRQTNTLGVPEVLGHGKAGDEIFLILDWVNTGNNDAGNQYLFGQQLAKMHSYSSDKFGLDHDNYMGSFIQKNDPHTSWSEFYISRRIEPQLKICSNNMLMLISNNFDVLFKILNELYPEEKPSFVHGDLWSGNYIISEKGAPFLIDPAVYYGNREVDIAMSSLFGGFSIKFYQGYNDEFPMQQGWQERLDLWNLYPLLVHLNLFGTAYLGQIKSILKKFT